MVFASRMLIGPAGLRAHLHDPAWVVFDCRHDMVDHHRGARVYAEGHVPGAFFAAVETDLAGEKTGHNGRHPLPQPETWAGFLNRHGVTPDTQIVAYDDAGGQYAARLWWLARWLGLTKVAVLDGGYGAWLAGLHPVSTEPAGPHGTGTVDARPDWSQVRTAADIQRGMADGSLVLVDARAPERFRGETEPIDRLAGHIPGARNRFFKLNQNPDQSFRPAAELRAAFTALLGAVPPAAVVHHCGSGVTACVNRLAMDYAGLPGSALYVGSWSEWIADPARPVATGPA